jgi:hypothetical protein
MSGEPLTFSQSLKPWTASHARCWIHVLKEWRHSVPSHSYSHPSSISAVSLRRLSTLHSVQCADDLLRFWRGNTAAQSMRQFGASHYGKHKTIVIDNGHGRKVPTTERSPHTPLAMRQAFLLCRPQGRPYHKIKRSMYGRLPYRVY